MSDELKTPDLDLPDGNWIDRFGACRVCMGEIPEGHTDNCDIWKMEMQIKTLTEATAALKAENDALRRDKQRLDWLQKGHTVLAFKAPDLDGHEFEVADEVKHCCVRTAIDAAMKQEEGK